MATATTAGVSPSLAPEYAVKDLHNEAIDTVNKTLQRNHEETHIYFNALGFHNHNMHFILTLYALGADADTIQNQFDRDMSYQRPPPPVDLQIVDSFKDPAEFIKGMTKADNYANFLVFFEREVQAKPWQDVVDEYIFKGDERANIMFNRLYASIVHGFIHLGIAVEFEQPLLVVEALAETAVAESLLDPFFEEVEKLAKSDGALPRDSMASLLHRINADHKVHNAVKHSDREKKGDGLLKRSFPEITRYAAQWQVSPETIKEDTADVVNAAVYAMAAAQNPTKRVKMDFGVMHSVTSCLPLTTLLRQDWISTANKVKLLAYKGRADLAEYAAWGSAPLNVYEIKNYPVKRGYDAVVRESLEPAFDGHIVKMIRALLHARDVCAPYEASDKLMIKADMWPKVLNMSMDSVQHCPGDIWVRGPGFVEAWEHISARV